MSESREWMYRRFLPDGTFNLEFLRELTEFIEFSSSQRALMDGDKLKCPCRRCDNIYYHTTDIVQYHIAKKGFVLYYYIWRFHGETEMSMTQHHNFDVVQNDENTYRTMVIDVAASQFNMQGIEEAPNPEAQQLYNMLNAADKKLFPGCKNHSQLSLVARLMYLKADGNQFEKNFDQWLELIKKILPEENLVPNNFYSTKKLLSGMRLPVEKIDCCRNSCMIYWREDSELIQCKLCSGLLD